MIQVLTQDVIRQHIDRIEPACVADLFALAETRLPGALAADLSQWAARAAREILDIPDGETRANFLAEVAEIPPESVPNGLRRAILALAPVSIADTTELVERLRVSWADIDPTPVKLAVPVAVPKAAAAPKTTTAKPRVVKTPASMIDPRRAEWIRGDAVTRLGSREYSERGLKESIFVAGIMHRSPYKDVTEEEVKAELRKLERERKLKHTGERWLIR
ncbi:MAG: hypothetical protein Q8P18_07875 [Pseudomonadota bacterium]|nr:hypothetical protein [Pseudomonadota bacterium]